MIRLDGESAKGVVARGGCTREIEAGASGVVVDIDSEPTHGNLPPHFSRAILAARASELYSNGKGSILEEMAEEIGIEKALVWIDPDSAEILFVNQLLVQRQDDEYVLTFGQQTPPVLTGTLEEKKVQAESIPYVPVRVAVRVATTRERMRRFSAILQELLGREEDRK